MVGDFLEYAGWQAIGTLLTLVLYLMGEREKPTEVVFLKTLSILLLCTLIALAFIAAQAIGLVESLGSIGEPYIATYLFAMFAAVLVGASAQRFSIAFVLIHFAYALTLLTQLALALSVPHMSFNELIVSSQFTRLFVLVRFWFYLLYLLSGTLGWLVSKATTAIGELLFETEVWLLDRVDAVGAALWKLTLKKVSDNSNSLTPTAVGLT